MTNLSIPIPPGAGWIILAGAGEFSFGETRELDELALSHIAAGSPKRVAFIPAASGSTEYATHLGQYLRTLDPDAEVVNVPIYRTRDARRERNLVTLREAAMIYIGGGVTNALVEALRGSPAIEAVRDSIARGTILFAIGAGCAALGVKTSNMRIPGNLMDGVALFPDLVIETAFDPTYDARLKRLASLDDVRFALGIPRLTGVVIAPDRSAQVVGSGQIGVIRKGDPEPAGC